MLKLEVSIHRIMTLNPRKSARFRADPANFRQKYFPADSAERPANVRRTLAEAAQIQADPRGLRSELAEEFTRKMSADKNLPYTRGGYGTLTLTLILTLTVTLTITLT